MEKRRQKALTSGEKTYSGNPCKKCGERKRYTLSAACICCSRRHSSTYRSKLRAVFQQAQTTAGAAKINAGDVTC